MSALETTFRALIAAAAVGALASAQPAAVSAASHMKSEPHTESGTSETEELRREWREALDALGNYSAGQRDRAVEKAQALTERMDTRIARLERQLEEDWSSLSESVRRERRETLQSLREQRQKVAEWYGGMKHGSSDAWAEVRKGFSDAYGALVESFGKAADALEQKAGEES